MNPVEALALAPMGAGLGSETMGDAGHAHGQVGLVEDTVDPQAAQGDLCGTHQAEVVILDGVDIGFLAAGIETKPGQDRGPR